MQQVLVNVLFFSLISKCISNPILSPSDSEHILDVKKSKILNISCTSTTPVQWNLPADSSSVPYGSGFISDLIEMEQTRERELFRAQLKIKLDSVFLTGRYDCVDNVSKVSTFVWARGGNLFDTPDTFLWSNVIQGRRTVIPCRPTDPAVHMRFIKDGVDVTNHLSKHLMSYEKTQGLIIERGEIAMHTGMITCLATRIDRNHEGSEDLYYVHDSDISDDYGKGDLVTRQRVEVVLNFVPVEHNLSPPHIVSLQNDSNIFFVGQSLSLECQLPIDRAEHNLELKWRYASSAKNVIISEQRRVNIRRGSPLHRLYPSAHVMLSRELSLDSLSVNNRGDVFECVTAMAGTDIASVETKFVLKNVLSRDSVFIGEPRFHGDAVISVDSRHKSVTWVLELQTYPQAKFTWLHPRGHKIDYERIDKYEFVQDDLDRTMRLSVNNVDIEDMGDYLLNVRVQQSNFRRRRSSLKERNITLTLLYFQQPHINLVNLENNRNNDNNDKKDYNKDGDEKINHGLIGSNSTLNLQCLVRGYPINAESLHWSFVPCTPSKCIREREGDLSSRPKTRITDEIVNGGHHYEYTSMMTTKPRGSGLIKCSVCSGFHPQLMRESCNSSELPIFLADLDDKDGLEIVGKTDNVVAGDNVGLRCMASKFLYQSIIWRRLDKGAWMDVEFVDRMDTEHSFVAEINFDAVQEEDAGHYECLGHAREHTEEMKPYFAQFSHLTKVSKRVKLDVLEVLAPRKADNFSMIDDHLDVDTLAAVKFDCFVHGRPRPNITWFKDGNIIDIDNESSDDTQLSSHMKNGTLELDNDGQTLLILFAVHEDSGLYACQATNRGGSVSGSTELFVSSVTSSTPIIIGASALIAACLLTLVLGGLLVWKLRIYDRKFKELSAAELALFEHGDPQMLNQRPVDLTSTEDTQPEWIPYNRAFELSRNQLTLSNRQLGAGAFGRVMKATAKGLRPEDPEKVVTVAVKMTRPQADISYLRALISELKILIHLSTVTDEFGQSGHINIVNLLGACTVNLAHRELLVVTEYCKFGNLQKYLMAHRSSFRSRVDVDSGQFVEEDVDNEENGDNESNNGEGAESNVNTNDEAVCNNGTDENGQVFTFNNGGCSSRVSMGQTSVRYVSTPRASDRITSVSSNDSATNNVVTTTDMTELPFSRSVSAVSSATARGPGWRSNLRADANIRDDIRLHTDNLIDFAHQVANGMEFLAKRKVLHGDLALRNVLLAEDHVVKICDFGLARELYKNSSYTKKSDGPLPVKWMAVESLRDRVFSSASDVWAFAIVLWEMFSLGKTPYPGIEAGEHFYDLLLGGYRMSRPDFCPAIIYETMKQCWSAEPRERPGFEHLVKFLADLMNEQQKHTYLNLSQAFLREHSNNHVVENKDYLGNHANEVVVGEEGYLLPNSTKSTDENCASSHGDCRNEHAF